MPVPETYAGKITKPNFEAVAVEVNKKISTTDANAAYVVRSQVADASVATTEGTTSTTFVDLATIGPAVTVTVGASGRVLVIVGATLFNSTATFSSFMAVAVSGATVRAADLASGLSVYSPIDTASARTSRVTTLTGLAPGSTTFTTKYRANGGTANFDSRHLTVIPL